MGGPAVFKELSEEKLSFFYQMTYIEMSNDVTLWQNGKLQELKRRPEAGDISQKEAKLQREGL